MHRERITPEMSERDAVLAMGGRNPGALNVLVALRLHTKAIDPMAPFDIYHWMNLDSMGIYDGAIWGLFSDVCGLDIGRMITLLEAQRLGFVSGPAVNSILRQLEAGGRLKNPFDFDDLTAKLRTTNPNFDPTKRAQVPATA